MLKGIKIIKLLAAEGIGEYRSAVQEITNFMEREGLLPCSRVLVTEHCS
jgi:hypothetical protein